MLWETQGEQSHLDLILVADEKLKGGNIYKGQVAVEVAIFEPLGYCVTVI